MSKNKVSKDMQTTVPAMRAAMRKRAANNLLRPAIESNGELVEITPGRYSIIRPSSED